ncbi:MAG TPA: N-acetylmuramoyl-L-alanine amidase [Chitinophagaceae bacterium]|nr:N-acetylmuramoyl-L-alanine amidase [Chitinophagaceae bacterium]
MIALFYYIIKVIVCSGILYGYYHFALRNRVFHEWNRFYLLTAVPFSILLPILDINIMAPADSDSKIITALQIVAGADEYILAANNSSAINWSTELITMLAYMSISLVFAGIFTAAIFRIMKMVRRYKPVLLENFFFINTTEPGTPFSFFKYLFWNEEISLEGENGKRILEHELVHIREKHSWDKIFIHIILVFFWINPFFWLIRQEMTMIHEFIADRRSVGRGDVNAFAKLILEASFPSHAGILTSSFFQSSIKRRLAMITKTTNPRLMYLSRLMMIPLLFLLVFTFAVKAKTLITKDEAPVVHLDQKYYVVIDAGHGGDDNGAISGSLKEKDVNLQLARMVKELNKNPSLELVLTRGDDKSTALPDRVKFAEEKNAQLFLSIHVASAPSATEKGITAFISKTDLSRYDQNVRFASLLLNNLSTIYNVDKSIKQRENSGIWVLDKNVCPAVILECGYLSNTDDRNYISSKANQEKIARQILKSIEDYFSKTVLIQPATPAVQLVKISANDTVPKSKAQTAKNPSANGNTEVVVQGYGSNKNTNSNNEVVVQGYGSNKNTNSNNEVVVQGYPSKKNDEAGVRYFVDGKEVNSAVANSINTDNIASVNVNKSNSTTGTINITTKSNTTTATTITVQGLKKGSPPPLYMLEGKEISEEEMKLIDPEKIESISVLKDKSAETLYGDKGKNGVIVITLKKRS